jgi:hypothetical protein
MNENLAQSSDIYEILFNENLNGLIINDKHYSNHILYKDNIKVYIQNELLESIINREYNYIKFIIKNSSKFIVLGFKSDMPSYVLTDDEKENLDTYSYNILNNDNENTQYKIVQLSYNYNDELFTDGNETYKIINNNYENSKTLIRHFKIIQININNLDSNPIEPIKKYFVYENNSNKLIGCFNSKEAQTLCINIQTQKGYNVHGVTENIYIKELSQNPNDNKYSDKKYEDESISIMNNYQNNALTFSKYYSILDLQNYIKDQSNISIYNYLDDINTNFENDEEFVNDIRNLVNNDNIYIRFAPVDSVKKYQNLRAFNLNNIYKYDNNLMETFAENSGMPIFNDNLFYSKNKCITVQNIINDKLEENGWDANTLNDFTEI